VTRGFPFTTNRHSLAYERPMRRRSVIGTTRTFRHIRPTSAIAGNPDIQPMLRGYPVARWPADPLTDRHKIDYP
jgi:hypothetical protein